MYTKQYLKGLIAEDRIEDVFICLRKQTSNNEIENDIIVLSSNYHLNEKERILEVITSESYQARRNQINNEILFLLDQLYSKRTNEKIEVFVVQRLVNQVELVFEEADGIIASISLGNIDLYMEVGEVIKGFSGDITVNEFITNRIISFFHHNLNSTLGLYYNKENLEDTLSRFGLAIQNDLLHGAFKFIYDEYNVKMKSTPTYGELLDLFKRFSGLNEISFVADIYEFEFRIILRNLSFRLQSEEQRFLQLKDLYDRRSCYEICNETRADIWSEVLLEMGVSKEELIPFLLQEWENYWDQRLSLVSNRGIQLERLEREREKSFRVIELFSKLPGGDVIELALDFDEYLLYPLVVCAMIRCDGIERCIGEYIGISLEHEDWTYLHWSNEDFETGIYIKADDDVDSVYDKTQLSEVKL